MECSKPVCAKCGMVGELKNLEVLGRSYQMATYNCDCLDREDEAEKVEKSTTNAVESGILPRLAPCTFEFWQHRKGLEESFKACKDYADNMSERIKQGDGLILTGAPGTGKTHLAVAVAQVAISQGRTVYVTNSTDFLRSLRPSAGDLHLLADKRARTVTLLVIDDLGKEKHSEWVEETLYSIVNHRLNSMLPTIYTTNHNSKELSAHIGEATVDRIIQSCKAVKFAGDSMRVKMRPEF